MGVFDKEKGIYRRPSKFTLKGTSDIIGVAPKTGRIICLEVKKDTGRPTVEQIAFINKINAMGGIAGIVRSIKDVEELLKDELY